MDDCIDFFRYPRNCLVGAISGTVKDPSGAVVPNANVSALRVDTGIAQKVTTNDEGLFTFPNLFVGTYRLTIEAPGFADDVVENQGMNGRYRSVPTTTNALIGTVQTAPGNLGRNTYTGPSWWNGDYSLVKNTSIGEGTKLQLRGDFFNIFNHPTFGTPNSALQTSVFGLSTNTATSERQIQLGARIMF